MPPFKKWTDADDWKLEEAQSDTVEIEHTHLGHLVALKKKELILLVSAMSEVEFALLSAIRNQLIVDSSASNTPPANELIVASAPSQATIDIPLPAEEEVWV